MKNTFNGKRFMALLQKDAQDLRSQYLKLILIVACTFLVAFLIYILTERTTYGTFGKVRVGIANLFVLGAILLAPFQLYQRYNHKIYGVNYFMLPASQAEKWLSMFVNCVIVTPVVIILTVTLIDLCLYPFYPSADKVLWFISYNTGEIKSLTDILMFFALQSVLFLGNIWFKRAKVQKTILAIIILPIIFAVFIGILVKVSGIVNILSGVPDIDASLSINSPKDLLIFFPQTWQTITKAIYFLIAPIGLWIVSFMKMKEQQL
jgi:hypothetical protein